MAIDREILRRARELFGDRSLGLFAFGSRVAGSPRPGFGSRSRRLDRRAHPAARYPLLTPGWRRGVVTW
jgi:hypothetical protein